MILMRTTMVRSSITLGTLMTIISKKRSYQRRGWSYIPTSSVFHPKRGWWITCEEQSSLQWWDDFVCLRELNFLRRETHANSHHGWGGGSHHQVSQRIQLHGCSPGSPRHSWSCLPWDHIALPQPSLGRNPGWVARAEQIITDLNARAEQIITSHIEALKEADGRSCNLERAKAESDRSLKAEINRLSRQLAIRESSNTPMSAMIRSLPEAGSTNRRGVENDDSSDRLESIHAILQRGRHDQRTTSGSSDTQSDRPSTLVHSIAHEAQYLKGPSIWWFHWSSQLGCCLWFQMKLGNCDCIRSS